MARWGGVLAAVLIGALGCDSGGGGGGDPDVGPEVDGAAGGGGEGGAGGADDGGPTADAAPVQSCFEDAECSEDSYCALINEFDGVCRQGCRRDPEDPEGQGSCEGRTICSEDHRCVPDPHCIEDLECEEQGTYCRDGDCVAGCRPDPDNCLPDDEGRSRRCDPDSRACERIVACCDDDACTTARESACGDPVPGVFSCFVEDLCDRVCQRDGSCPDDQFCSERSLCEPGCRLDDPESCPGQRCDPDSRACTANPCEGDGDCRPDQFCAPQGCLSGCRANPDNCPAGTECGPNRQCRAVGGCRDDAQCVADNGEGWRCVDGECEPFCDADEDCRDGEFCDLEVGLCERGCRDDDLEPNDERRSATPLQLVDGAIRIDGLQACDLDRDWYSFVTPAGFGATATVRFRHAAGDLDLRLHPPLGDPVASQSANNDETASIESAAAGTWYVEVYARGLDTNRYDLEVELIPPGGCAPDAAEVAGDDRAGAATDVDVPGLQDVEVFRDRTACGDDADWYRVPMGQGDGLTVELTLVGGDAPLDFAIYGPGQPAPDAEPTFVPNGGDAETLRFTAPRPSPQISGGNYYIKVISADPEGGAAYQLRITVDRSRALCLIDEAEPNDERADASDLMQSAALTRIGFDGLRELRPDVDLDVEGLWLCAGDSDWFTLEARPGDDLSVSVIRHDADIVGDVEVEILNAAGQVVGLPGRNAQRLNTARAPDLPGGRYFVRVGAPAGNTQTQYTLRVNRSPGPVDCPADRFEVAGGNESRATAGAVRAGRIEGLTLCGVDGDDDWYRLELLGVADLEVRAIFSSLQANIDVDVYRDDAIDPENVNTPMGHGAGDDERVTLPNRSPGVYYIRVYTVGGGDARYTLEIDVVERAFVCEDDPDEPNDMMMMATDLGSEEHDRQTQWLCDRVPAEVDWFRLRVPGGQGRTIVTPFLFGDDGDLIIEAYDAQGALLASTGGVPRELSKQCLTVPPFVADRTLFLRVLPLSINRVLQDDERLDYSLRVLRGEDRCDDVPPATPGIMWPVVAPPN